MNLPWLDPNAGRSPIGEGLSGIADSLMESRRLDQQRQQQMADQLLKRKQAEADEGRLKIAQQREDRAAEQQNKRNYADALLVIKKHLAPGPDFNPDYARAVAEANGITEFGQDRGEAPAPAGPSPPMGQPPSPAMSAPPPPGPQSPPPPSFAMGPPGRSPSMQAPPQPPPGPPMGPDRSAVEPPPMSTGGGPPVEERDQHRAANAGYAQQLADHPQLVGEHAQAVEGFKAHRATVGQTAGYPIFRAKGPNGEDLRFDTGTGEQSVQMQQQKAQESGLAAADEIEKLPGMQAAAKNLRMMAHMAGLGAVKPEQIAAHIEKLMGMENQVSIAQGHDTTRLAAAKKKGGGGTGTGYNLKTEKQNETELTHIESEKNRFLKASGLDKTIAAHNELAKAQRELELAKNNPQTQIGVLDRLVKANVGGKATIGQIRVQLEHMGAWDAQMQGWYEGKLGTGGLGEQRLRTMMGAIAAAKQSTEEEINSQHEAFVGSHFGGADYNQKGNWEKAHKDIFGQVRDASGKEMFATEYDPNAPTIVRGSGQRSGSTVGVNAKAGTGTHPLVSAAKQGNLSPEKQKLAADARAKKPGDPLYDSAQRWLQAHGL